MSFVRFLPTPSDRMGIIWSLLNVRGSLILEYGPSGTTHYSMGLYGGLGIKFQNRLFTTHMSEDDVVMGDVTRLEQALLELDKAYEPEVIFVVASSVTAVIGTDIKGVCNYMQQDVKAKLIAFEQGGFRGDYSVGVAETYKLLAKHLPKSGIAVRKGCYNIIGASAWHYRVASDLWEVKELLNEALQMQCNACLCNETSVAELAELGAAEVNIVLSYEGLEAAKLLQAKFGTPYVYATPYGYKGTLSFLEQVGAAVGRTPEAMVLMRLNMKQKGLSMLQMLSMMTGVQKKPRAILKGEYDTILGIAAFLEEAGFAVEQRLCEHAVKNAPEPEAVTHFSEEKEWLAIMRTAKDMLVLADEVALTQCDDSNMKVLISCPYLKGSQIAKHFPFMGEKGADYLLELAYSFYQR